MSVLAVIPARLGATRLPRKPLRELGGLPLVVRVYERVISLEVADECVVATDAVEIIEVCSRHGIPAVLTSSHHPSGTDRVAEVAERLHAAQADDVQQYATRCDALAVHLVDPAVVGPEAGHRARGEPVVELVFVVHMR